MKKTPPPSNFRSLTDDYREQLETSFKRIKKGKQPAKVKCKMELDWLKEDGEATLRKPLRRQLDKYHEEF